MRPSPALSAQALHKHQDLDQGQGKDQETPPMSPFLFLGAFDWLAGWLAGGGGASDTGRKGRLPRKQGQGQEQDQGKG